MKRSMMILTGLALATGAVVQASLPSALVNLRGKPTSQAAQELNQRGYRYQRNEPGRDSVFEYWWNSQTRQCVRIEIYRRAVNTVDLMPESSCRGGGNGGGGGFGRPDRDDLPGGSWLQTCTDEEVRGPVLRATCRAGRGSQRTSEINFRQCRNRRVANIGGQLTCESGIDTTPMPGGQWVLTCRDGYWEGDRLVALCKDMQGRALATSIRPKQCPTGRLGNINGRLTCE